MTAYRDRLNAGHYTPEVPTEEATVDQLKQQLRNRNLPVTGTKDELIARLADANTNDNDTSDNDA